MLDMPIEFKNPTKKDAPHPNHEISSIVTIKGEISGSIVLSYPKGMAMHVASELIDEKHSEFDSEVTDAINEISNMVTGVADTDLELENVSYSLPTVVKGKGKIAYPVHAFVFCMTCIMDAGTFEVDIALY